MANPQPHQFTRLSNELYKAIMQSDFTKRQRNILDLVIRMSYGCGKKSALLRPVDFELVGIYKTHIRKELDYLSKAAVLIIDGDRITLNKNYDQWRISLSRNATNTDRWSEVLRRNLNDEVTETVTKEEDKVTKTVTDGYQNSNQVVTKTVTEEGRKPSNANGSEAPKESIKESIKERSLSLTGEGHSPPAASQGQENTPPNNQQLIAELVRKYRETGAKSQKGDYPFIGRLYNEFGYDRVLMGINALGYKLAAGFHPDDPLIYLGGIVRKEDKPDAKIRGDPVQNQKAGQADQYAKYNALFKTQRSSQNA